MKKILSVFMCLMIGLLCYGQAPQAFSYQAVAIGDNGSVIANQNIGVKVNINVGSATGGNAYSETHTVTTSSAGLFSIEVGNGTPLTNTFSDINWATGAYFLSVEVDENNLGVYQSLGVRQLLSVPYALYAETGGIGPEGLMGPVGPIGPVGVGFFFNQPNCSGPSAPSGPAGPIGPPGIKGPPGSSTNCWDLNSNLVNDVAEDRNGDGLFSALDCTSAPGIQGLPGPAGPAGPASNVQGPPGDIGFQGFQGIPGPKGPKGPTPECSLWTEDGDNLYNMNLVGVGTSTPSCALDVVGQVSAYGLTLSSDLRYKQNIQLLEGGLEKIKQLEGVHYLFKTEKFANHYFPENLQVGLIAQEVEKVFPELVLTKADGYKAVNYSKLSPILLEALKTLYLETETVDQSLLKQYEALNKEIEEFKTVLTNKQ